MDTSDKLQMTDVIIGELYSGYNQLILERG